MNTNVDSVTFPPVASKKVKTDQLFETILRKKVSKDVVPVSKQKFLKEPCSIDVIGVAFSAGQPKMGAEWGPSLLIKAGLLDQLENLGWKVNCPEKLPSYDDLNPVNGDSPQHKHHKLKNVEFVSSVTRSVHEKVKKACKEGSLGLTLGGDHSLGIATVSASLAAYPNIGVIWVDAHADINTAETTASGNLHGCPVSFLLGLEKSIKAFSWVKPYLKKNRIVYIGLRDVDPDEKRLLKENNILAFSMHEVDKYGISEVMNRTFAYLGKDSPLHLSFDVDALDPTVAPATGTPVRGGLTFREGHFICEAIFETGCLVAMDLMEVNPELGENDIAKKTTVNIGCSLIRAATGETLL